MIIVSHADPIKAIVTDALGLHLDLFQRVFVSPASVSAIAYGDLAPSVMLVNWTGPSATCPEGGDGGEDKPAGAAHRRRK